MTDTELKLIAAAASIGLRRGGRISDDLWVHRAGPLGHLNLGRPDRIEHHAALGAVAEFRQLDLRMHRAGEWARMPDWDIRASSARLLFAVMIRHC